MPFRQASRASRGELEALPAGTGKMALSPSRARSPGPALGWLPQPAFSRVTSPAPGVEACQAGHPVGDFDSLFQGNDTICAPDQGWGGETHMYVVASFLTGRKSL